MFPLKQKYIITEDNNIIVFSELFQHSRFSGFNPISAGFLSINTTKDKNGYHNPSISCYGKSVSLNLESRPQDTEIAEKQILGNYE